MEPTTREALGRYLKALAQAHTITQNELAGVLSIDRGMISRVWRGQVVKPTHYIAVAEHFGLSLDDALERAEQHTDLIHTATEGTMSAAPILSHDDDDQGTTRSGSFGKTARVIAVASEKGGVGKTATAVNLAYEWAAMGHKVCLVDLDSQGNATRHLGLDLGGEAMERATRPSQPEELVVDAECFGFDVVTGGRQTLGALSNIEAHRVRLSVVRRKLLSLMDAYDLIVLDTPPSVGTLSLNALVAATHLVIPLQLEGGALDGLDNVLQTVEEILEINPGLKVLGTVGTMEDRRVVQTRMIWNELTERDFAEPVLGIKIPRNVSVSEAYLAQEPVGVYAPSSRGAKAYHRLAEILAERLEQP